MSKGTCHSCEAAGGDERPADCTCCPTCGSPWCDWLGEHPPTVTVTTWLPGDPEPEPAPTRYVDQITDVRFEPSGLNEFHPDTTHNPEV